jgi:hypothetical protein
MRKPVTSRLAVLFAGAVVSIALAAVGASAYLSGQGHGTAAGGVNQLGASTISSATAGAGTVALSWSAVSAPGAGSVTYYVRRDGAAAAGTCPTAASPTSVTSCTDSGLSPGSHVYTVTAVWRTWTRRGAERSVSVAVGVADHLLLSAATTTPTAGASDSLTITAKDSANNTVTTYTGSKSLTFAGASLAGSTHPTVTNSSGTAVAFGTAETIGFTSGVATVSGSKNGSMTLYKAETALVTVTDGTLSNGSGLSLTVAPAGTSAFSLPTPATQTAGTLFNETITATDQYGNTTPSYTGSHSVTFEGPAKSPGGKSPSYPSSVTFSSGVGTASVTLYDAQSTTLGANFSAGSGSSGSFTVKPAAATSLGVANPGAQIAGSPFNETITAIDAYGNTQPSYEGSKSLSFSGPASSPSGKAPVYPSTVTFTAGAGTAQVTLYDAQSTTLGASDGTLAGTSTAFTVAAASAASFSLSTPATQTAGNAFSETLTAKDTYGNTATGYTGSKTVTFTGPATSPGGKAPAYPGTVSFSSGAANASITLYDAQSTSLTATQSTIAGTTPSFTVKAAGTGAFTLSTPATQTAGSAFSVTLTAADAYGNAVSPEGPQTITFSGPEASPSEKAPSYPASVTFSGSSATASITLYDATGAVSLTATQGSAKGTSASFAVNPAAAGKLAWTAPSGNGEAEGLCLFTCTWVGFSKNKTWTAKVSVTDAYGNIVSNVGSGHNVSLTEPSNGSISTKTLTMPSASTATSSTSVTYTAANSNSWPSDSLTASTGAYTSATLQLKR